MPSAYQLTLFSHLALGVAALGTYWVAALARKGSRPHKLAGKAYLLTMLGLLVPAVPLSIRTALHYSLPFGAFLFYLLLITLTALWTGWFASKYKRDWARFTGTAFRRIAWANIAAGAAVLAVGLQQRNLIFVGFSLVGLLGGRRMLRQAASGPGHPRWWLGQHFGGMLGAGVATHIAFLSIGLPRLFPMLAGPLLQNIAWLGPLVLAGLARTWLTRRYLASTTTPPSTALPGGNSAPA
jgi:hypothetical protein